MQSNCPLREGRAAAVPAAQKSFGDLHRLTVGNQSGGGCAFFRLEEQAMLLAIKSTSSSANIVVFRDMQEMQVSMALAKKVKKPQMK